MFLIYVDEKVYGNVYKCIWNVQKITQNKLPNGPLSSLKKYTLKNFENFYGSHKKLNFVKFEYPKSDRFLHIFETVVNCNIVCKNVLLGYFCQEYLQKKQYQEIDETWKREWEHL